ncbi:hypothetical protein G9A89_006775 [Geosiphon pyriformis]|nr:hypothetical protein G9A89_006775 [Geosiphon pyriformis]
MGKIYLGPDTPGYMDLQISALYASTAYCFKESKDKVANGVYVKAELIFNGHNQQIIMISFKADFPKTFEDWSNKLFNFDSKFADSNGVNFDSEFYKRYKSLERRLISKIEPILEEAKTLSSGIVDSIRFVGHGMGEVFAILAGYHMALQPNNPFEVIVHTFGQPRIGNTQSTSFIWKLMNEGKMDVLRVTHSNDYLPRIPQSSSFLHPPFEMWIESDCNCRANDGNDRVYGCYGPFNEFLDVYIESNECLNGQPTQSKIANLGPYFQHIMGKCPHPDFEE